MKRGEVFPSQKPGLERAFFGRISRKIWADFRPKTWQLSVCQWCPKNCRHKPERDRRRTNCRTKSRLGQRLNHSEFLPVLDDAQDIWGAFLNAEVPKRMLLNRIERLTGQILSQARTVIDDRDARFRGVVVIAHTLSGYCRGPMLLTATRLITRNDLFKSPAIIGPEEELIRQFNDAAQVVFTA